MFLTTLILCFVQSVLSQTCTNKQKNNLIYTDVTPGKLLFGIRILNPFLILEPVSLWTCVEHCMRRSECKSFNFCEKMNICELNYSNRRNTQKETSKTKSLYVQSNIHTWNEHLYLIGNCKDIKCDLKHHCNTSGLCELSDCGPPPKLSAQNAVIVGQGDHRIGNGVFVGCKDPYVMKDSSGAFLPGKISLVKCNDIGDWEIPSFTCEDMTVFDDHWYYYSQHEAIWENAMDFCHAIDFCLVTIDNHREKDWITKEVSYRGHSVWVGGNDHVIEGTWIWEYDDSPVKFKLTNNDGGTGQNCLEMGTGSGSFSDATCTYRLRFICEQRK